MSTISFIKQKIYAYISGTDKWLWILSVLVSSVSLILIYGILKSGYHDLLRISSRNVFVQGIATGMGIISAFIISIIDYKLIKKAWFLYIPLCYILVLLTFFIGVGTEIRPDDKRWLIMPIIGVGIQPAEILKVSFVLAFSHHITKCEESLNKPVNMLLLCLHAALPILLIHFQGDDGTALLIALIAVAMLFMAGINWKYITAGVVALAAAVPVFWRYILSDFQKDRIQVLLNQADADPMGLYYQQYRAKIAIAMGGKTGIGLMSPNHVYVPEMDTDFIFSFLCESFGFMGALGILTLMTVICMKILYNSFQVKNRYGSLVCVGVFAMIAFQVAVNVGMCLSVFPVIGNTFPLLSCGGSSVISTYMGIGLVLSVYSHKLTGMFHNEE